ncbi:MAG: hypothetical protein ACOYZ7_01805 [Chloroflexota bacterium]
MIKKILLGTAFVGLLAVLVAGGVIRTLDKTSQVAEARGAGQGYGVDHQAGVDGQETGYGQGNGNAGAAAGSGLGRGQGNGLAERQYANLEAAPEEWLEYQGTVLQPPADGVDLVILTADGEELTVGTGPMYMAGQGFTLQAGEQIQVRGYWEDGEFKAAQVTRHSDGRSIDLRDESGRPLWGGRGQGGRGRAGE